MKRELTIFLRWIAILFVLLAIISVINNTGFLLSKDHAIQESRCPPIFNEFSDFEIVGTWNATSVGKSDTLIIRSNGTYRQIVNIVRAEGPGIDYESDWHPWHIKMSEDNIPYLHLTNFAFCGMNVRISCSKRNCGGHDFCRDEYMKMDGEGILLVLGPSSSEEISPDLLPQYYINLFYPLGDQGSWAYEFVEQ
jgi:hypothetical protein